MLPVNDAPEAVGVVPVQALEEGGERVTLDIAPYFTDIDGDVLTYSAESSNPAAAVVAVNGSTLTLSAVVTGTATVTVTATDPEGLTATQVFAVAVGDRLVRAVLTDSLAALGRGHLSSVRQTVGRRLETGGSDTPRMMVGGQMLGPGLWGGRTAGGLAQTHDWLFWSATLQQPGAARDLLGTSADPRLRRTGMFNGFSGFGNLDRGWEQALSGTDVLMTFGDDEDAAGPQGRGRRWTIWGQGDLQTFRGTPSDVRGYEGDLRTGYIGFDTQVGSNWLLGVAAARSGGEGAWQAGTATGRLETTLTRAHPYVRWSSGDTAVWGVAGLGRGTATLVRTANGQRDTSPLRLALGLVEGRRRVATVGPDLEVAVRGEVSWAQLATGAGVRTVDALEAGVRRTRGGVEVTRALSGPGGSTWTPFGAVSTRHDGGAGQTGVGLEVAGGVRVRGGRMQFEAQGRKLALHSATDYAEQGVAVAASFGSSPYEPGLTLSLRPTWGAAGMGAESLWQDEIQSYLDGVARDAAGIDARVGYGLRLPGGGLLTPFGAYGERQQSGRRLQVGALVGTLGQPGSLDHPIQLEIAGERYERPGNSPDHRFSMVGVVNLGGPRPTVGPATSEEPAPTAPVPEAADPSAARDAVPLPEATLVGVTASEATIPDVATGEEVAPPLVSRAREAVRTTPAMQAQRIAAPAPVADVGASRETAAPVTRRARVAPNRPARSAGAAVSAARVDEPSARESAAPTVPDARAKVPGEQVTHPNRPPTFSKLSYEFVMPGHPGASVGEAAIGAVAARDPDHDPVTYALAAGDWRRFTVGSMNGDITWVGSQQELAVGPRRYELTVTARDTGRLVSAATVVVTVAAARPPARTADDQRQRVDALPPAAPDRGRRTGPASVTVAVPTAVGSPSRAVDESPEALGDRAETREDKPILIDVLANDRGPNGDRLRIVAVSTPAHGTAAVVESEILYMPEPGYYGSDTFSYTVAGRSGMTGRAAVAVNVLSTNEPHVVEAGTPTLGGEPMTVPRLAAGIAYEDAPVAVDRGLDASAERETRPAGNGRRSPLRRVRMHNRH